MGTQVAVEEAKGDSMSEEKKTLKDYLAEQPGVAILLALLALAVVIALL